jgi:hypothetical protein
MLSSALVGTLWAAATDPAWGFGAAAALQTLGALMVAFMQHGSARPAGRS